MNNGKQYHTQIQNTPTNYNPQFIKDIKTQNKLPQQMQIKPNVNKVIKFVYNQPSQTTQSNNLIHNTNHNVNINHYLHEPIIINGIPRISEQQTQQKTQQKDKPIINTVQKERNHFVKIKFTNSNTDKIINNTLKIQTKSSISKQIQINTQQLLQIQNIQPIQSMKKLSSHDSIKSQHSFHQKDIKIQTTTSQQIFLCPQDMQQYGKDNNYRQSIVVSQFLPLQSLNKDHLPFYSNHISRHSSNRNVQQLHNSIEFKSKSISQSSQKAKSHTSKSNRCLQQVIISTNNNEIKTNQISNSPNHIIISPIIEPKLQQLPFYQILHNQIKSKESIKQQIIEYKTDNYKTCNQNRNNIQFKQKQIKHNTSPVEQIKERKIDINQSKDHIREAPINIISNQHNHVNMQQNRYTIIDQLSQQNISQSSQTHHLPLFKPQQQIHINSNTSNNRQTSLITQIYPIKVLSLKDKAISQGGQLQRKPQRQRIFSLQNKAYYQHHHNINDMMLIKSKHENIKLEDIPQQIQDKWGNNNKVAQIPKTIERRIFKNESKS